MALAERFVDRTEIDRVLTFFRDHKPPQHILGQDREFLIWQFSPERCRGFEGAGLSAVTLWDGNEIVGFLGVIGCGFNRNGVVIDGGWLCNLVVLPDYRAVGGWMRLMKAVHRLPIGAVAVVGFPPRIGQLYRAMGYQVRERLFRFVRIVDPEQTGRLVAGKDWLAYARAPVTSPLPSSIKIEPVSVLDQRWDAFWRSFAERGYFGTDRDSSYMTWRYLGHPRLQFVIKAAVTSDGAIKGAVTYRVERVKDRPEQLIRLLEVLALDDETYAGLLQAVMRDAEELGVAFIDHYSTRPLHVVFQNVGWFEETDVEDTVIPGLFQPLVPVRRSLNAAVRLLEPSAPKGLDYAPDLYVVKSDGDQDRPS
jgi:GNAT superfamily N-acetyltransferase